MAAFMARTRWFSSSSIDRWEGVKPAAKDPIFAITEAFLADDFPSRINLGEGTYRDEKGRPVILECVRRAEAKIGGVQTMEYPPIGGDPKLVQETIKLVYGENSDAVKENRVAGIQALSGTGSCRLFAEFQRRFRPETPMYLPIPTWSNHHDIWRDAHVTQRTFHYYHHQSKGLDFPKLMEDVKETEIAVSLNLHAHRMLQILPFSCSMHALTTKPELILPRSSGKKFHIYLRSLFMHVAKAAFVYACNN